ncbi:HNH endonuclease [Flavobacterium turcicum]|uniref:HNH endonuclease n=1 Tax=Flavobacterium turcicum TaxID=2764718 RepID=A0ABR7JE42_9FLAO|nr:hypothetical protein [Flavobacterium turcicum]MBC5862776.1 hypothetical protein [Flavobacterium turcicum]NHL01508.1 hypothetical protein [Flavobacterium turcicum]
MRKINKPALTAAMVYPECLTTVGDNGLRGRLERCQTLINDAETEFEAKITKGQIYTIARETVVNGNVTYKELKNVYTAQMVRKPKGRVYYDQLIMAAPEGLCPLCSHREATTLDHYLPKSKYPRLSIVPINLIPSCKDCNTGKLADYPTGPDDETLHPYYDNIENVIWLNAIVNKTTPVSLSFNVKAPTSWDNLLKNRVTTHLDCFKLNILYASQAARRLSGMKYNLEKIYSSGAAQAGIVKYLADEAASNAAINLNSWETAMFKALSEDDWFCSTGFRLIG